MSHWLPPPTEVAKRGKGFSTFFFAGRGEGSTSVDVDGSEITEHVWLRPDDALASNARGELKLLPPTWMTLEVLARCRCTTVDGLLEHLGQLEPTAYETRSAPLPDGRMAYLFEGDAGWPTSDPTIAGARLRLVTAHASSNPREELSPPEGGAAILTLQRTPAGQAQSAEARRSVT